MKELGSGMAVSPDSCPVYVLKPSTSLPAIPHIDKRISFKLQESNFPGTQECTLFGAIVSLCSKINEITEVCAGISLRPCL